MGVLRVCERRVEYGVAFLDDRNLSKHGHSDSEFATDSLSADRLSMEELLHLNPHNLQTSRVLPAFKRIAEIERKITAQVIEFIMVIEERQLYLVGNCTSLFGFLTTEMGYSNAPAQQSIDAARMMKAVPEMKEDLESGALNLSTVGAVASALKRKKRDLKAKGDKTGLAFLEEIDTRSLIEMAKGETQASTELLMCQTLEIEAIFHERAKIQRDKSVRFQFTLSERQVTDHERVMSLISHTHPNPTMADIHDYLLQYFLNREDPIRKAERIEERQARRLTDALKVKRSVLPNNSVAIAEEFKNSRAKRSELQCHSSAEIDLRRSDTSDSEVRPQQELVRPKTLREKYKFTRDHIPAAIRREVLRRSPSCEHRYEGVKCNSTFQAQVDHIISVWLGGTNELSNLQTLCAKHNRLKFEREICIRRRRELQSITSGFAATRKSSRVSSSNASACAQSRTSVDGIDHAHSVHHRCGRS